MSQSGGQSGLPNADPAGAPFKAWLEWLESTMGTMSAAQGATVPSPASSGIPTRGAAQRVPGGGSAGDPLISAMVKLSGSNPMSDIVPVDWTEISRALQTLWMRAMSDPQRAVHAATEYNLGVFETTTKAWSDAASRFWGVPPREQEAKGRPDKRFAEPEWESKPYYRLLKEMYLLASEYLLEEAQRTDGQDSADERRLAFHVKQFVDAMAPVNFLLSNPAALRRIRETGGMSLVDGAGNLMSDLEAGRLSMVDANAFTVGENLATTAGQVVYRNKLIELIQYEPRTERVHERPILFLPPWINKYYILDLSEKNSFVKYLVDQGFTVFMTSWKNPDASMEQTGFDDYMTMGPRKAVEVIHEITASDKVNPAGYCIGGLLLVMTLAWLAAGDDREAEHFGDPTFMVSLQDYSEVGDTEVFMDEPQFEAMEMQMMERGYLDDREMANMFNLLRSSDLIWANVINNYLLGLKPPAFDLLYWNNDGTRMARGRPLLLCEEHLPREQPHGARQGGARGPRHRPRTHHERRLRRGRREGPHRALEVGLEDQQARQHELDPLHPRRQRTHRRHDLPAGEGQGLLDGRRRPLRDRRGVAPERRAARGHLVGGLDTVARAALREAGRSASRWAATSTRRWRTPPAPT